jgi:N-acetylmuramoyl-L-alanine amidase
MLRHTKTFSFVVISLVLAGCTTSGTITELSQNYNSRVSIVVIHHTTGDFDDSLHILTQPSSNPVSSHYLIPEPGDSSYDKSKLQVYSLVPEGDRAWHAGTSHWAGKNGVNDQSIGIELVNRTYCRRSTVVDDETKQPTGRICFFPDFADSQIALLVDLRDKILERHPDIRPTHITGHADIAPDRKIDPGPRFPWQRLYRLGYGAWFDDETVIRYWEQFTQQPLPVRNVQAALKAYGYGIEVSGELDEQTHNVLRAFQMHFRPSEVSNEPTTTTVAILFALIEKYYPEQLDDLLIVEEDPVVMPEPVPADEAAG